MFGAIKWQTITCVEKWYLFIFQLKLKKQRRKGLRFNFQELKPNTIFFFFIKSKSSLQTFFSAEIRNKCGFFLQVEQNFYFSRKLHKSEKTIWPKRLQARHEIWADEQAKKEKNSLKLVHSSTGYQIKFASHLYFRFYF